MSILSHLVKPVALAALLYASQASAALHLYVDDTTGSPTFNRPFSLTDLSTVGTDVAYDTFSFSVSAAGDYLFRSLAFGPKWDNFLLLYTGSFDPGAALTNLTALNDDFNGNIGRAGFDVALATGVAYTLVTTGFDNDDVGKYLNIIRGPGAVTPPVPEPETYLMMIAGIAAIGFMVRRRNAG